MLLATAPPARMTWTPAAEVRPPEIWKIHAERHGIPAVRAYKREERKLDSLSVAVPDMVTEDKIETAEVHL